MRFGKVIALLTLAALSGPGLAQSYTYRVTDAMVGTSTANLNTDFWQPWSPVGPPGITVTAQGTEIAGTLSYLGIGTGSAPWWTFSGDLRASIYVSNDIADRISVTLRAATCTSWGSEAEMVGLWGGSANTAPPQHYFMPSGSGAYYLFEKTGTQLLVRQGSALGVSALDPIVAGPVTVNAAGTYVFYMGSGDPNSGRIRVRDLVLDTQVIASCRTSVVVPPSWTAAPVVPPTPVPMLGGAGLAALLSVLGFAGMRSLRRRERC